MKDPEIEVKTVEKIVLPLEEEKYEPLEKSGSAGQMVLPLTYSDNEEPYIVGTRSSEIENKLRGYSIDSLRSVERMK